MAWWLGGSGVVLKTPAGTQVYIDPYLSDCVRDIFGIARAFPPPITPEKTSVCGEVCVTSATTAFQASTTTSASTATQKTTIASIAPSRSSGRPDPRA